MPLTIDKTWTLFLDRDGVINERLPDDYVKSIDQFKLIKGTLDAMVIFAELFNHIIVVSNQQGIGKGLMSLQELEKIHKHFEAEVTQAGGRIDKFYISPYLHSERHFTRKPAVGMGIMAKKEFRDISFRKAIMAGDSMSDMLFGKRLGMKTVFIGQPEQTRQCHDLIDFCYPDILFFARTLMM